MRPERTMTVSRRGTRSRHYSFEDFVAYASGIHKHPELMKRHLDNCRNCRVQSETAKHLGREIHRAFAEIEE